MTAGYTALPPEDLSLLTDLSMPWSVIDLQEVEEEEEGQEEVVVDTTTGEVAPSPPHHHHHHLSNGHHHHHHHRHPHGMEVIEVITFRRLELIICTIYDRVLS